MSLAVVVNVHSGVDAQTLEEFFKALGESKEKLEDVFIITDKRREDLEGLIKKLVPEHRYLVADENQEGHKLSILRNRAAAETDKARLLFIDADCIPDADCIARHIQLGTLAIIAAGLVMHKSAKADKWVDPRAKVIKADYDIYEMSHVESGCEPKFMWADHLSFPTRFFKEAGGFWEGCEHKGIEGQELCQRMGPSPKDAAGTCVGCVLRIEFGCKATRKAPPALRPKKELRAEVNEKSAATQTKYPQWRREGRSLPPKKPKPEPASEKPVAAMPVSAPVAAQAQFEAIPPQAVPVAMDVGAAAPVGIQGGPVGHQGQAGVAGIPEPRWWFDGPAVQQPAPLPPPPEAHVPIIQAPPQPVVLPAAAFYDDEDDDDLEDLDEEDDGDGTWEVDDDLDEDPDDEYEDDGWVDDDDYDEDEDEGF